MHSPQNANSNTRTSQETTTMASRRLHVTETLTHDDHIQITQGASDGNYKWIVSIHL